MSDGSVFWFTKYHTGSSDKDLWRTYKWTCPRFERERLKLTNTGTGTIQCFEVTLSDINASAVTITNAGAASPSSGSSSSATVAISDMSAVRRGHLSLGSASIVTGSNRIDLATIYNGAGPNAPSGTSDTYKDLIENGDLIFLLKTAGTMPGGLSENTAYYVVGRTVSGLSGSNIIGFQLSATKGGNPINISSAGSGGDLHIFEAIPRQTSAATTGTNTVSDGDGSVAAGSTTTTAISVAAFNNLVQTASTFGPISIATSNAHKEEIKQKVIKTQKKILAELGEPITHRDELVRAIEEGALAGAMRWQSSNMP